MRNNNRERDSFNVSYEPSRNGELSKLTAKSNKNSNIEFVKKFYGRKADHLYDKLTKP